MLTLQLPPIAPPESAMLPGMAAPDPEQLIAALSGYTGGFPNIPDTSGPPPIAYQQPTQWFYDLDPASGISRATYLGEVVGSSGPAVTSFNTRTGAVVLTTADVTGAGGAPIASPAFTGTPTAPTQPTTTNNTDLATTAFAYALAAAGYAFSGGAANPAGTSSSTPVMAGLSVGAGFFTPHVTGRMLLIASGDVAGNTVSAQPSITMRYAAGNGPANGAAATGTVAGNTATMIVPLANMIVPFAIIGVVTGLALGTGYWLDLTQAVAAGGGTINLYNVVLSAVEI